MEETNWLFDEIFQRVYPEPKEFPELQSYKDFVRETLDIYYDWVDPYELWYYYINNYVMRYVNNYYDYDRYDPRIFKKNIFRALHNYCGTQQEKVIEMARNEVLSITETNKYKIKKVFHNGNIGTYHIKYIWKTSNKEACKYCKSLNNKEFTSKKMIHQHWNCRCKIEQHIQIISNNGEILFENVKIL